MDIQVLRENVILIFKQTLSLASKTTEFCLCAFLFFSDFFNLETILHFCLKH